MLGLILIGLDSLVIKSVYLFESFGWILQKIEFIGDIGTVQSYLKKWGKRVNFDNGVPKIARKSKRGSKDKWCDKGEKKKLWQ